MTTLDKTMRILPNSNRDAHFGNKLQALRGLYRMTQKEMAHYLGISQKAYSRLEQKKEPPIKELVEQIWSIFNKFKRESSFLNEKQPNDLEKDFLPSDTFSAILLQELKTEFENILTKNMTVGTFQVEISIKISHKEA